MKRLLPILLLFCASSAALAQSNLVADWTVASFIQPCTEQYNYRNILPGPIVVGDNDTLTWLYRDRSSCHSPYNNFHILKMLKDGSPLLSFFRKFDTPGDYYAEQIAIHKNIVYWAGSSYTADTGRSVFLAAIDLNTGDTLWVRRWMPLGKTSYQIVAMMADDKGIYLSASATVALGEPIYIGYAMLLAAWDPDGTERWTNVFVQPFYQNFRGNIIATDSLVYACASRYSDVIPYYRGMGFVGAYDISSGRLVDSFYFAKKRPQSEYIPALLAEHNGQVIVVGTNSSMADAAMFVSSLSSHLDSVSFYLQTPAVYSYLSAAAVDENGFLYIGSYQYLSTGYRSSLDVANCKAGCYPIHRNMILEPDPLSISYLYPHEGSLYVSMSANSPDTTLDIYNRRDGYVAKFNSAPLAVGRPHGAGTSTEVTIAPHPVTTFATMTSAMELRNGVLELRDALGRSLRRFEGLAGTSFVVSREGLSSGIYFYSLSDDGKTMGSGKIVIE